MKPEIHPVYPPSRVTCACGNVIETRTTRGSFNVEICSNCHPFFTGKYKLMDTEGRVERFRKKYETKAGAGADGKTAVPTPNAAAASKKPAKPAAAAEAKPAKAAAKAEPSEPKA